NVAVTRAKEVLYVVGNRADWSEAGFFHTVSQVMDDFSMAHPYAPEAEAALFEPPSPTLDPAAAPAPAPAPQVDDAGSIFDLGLDLGSADQAEPPVPGFG
ncbi:MAG: hypothetical protein JXJ30_06375, partial [Halothiobacillaceae bacterium]|nr:hypothetical protein [Halothiobacillaceae bacterium]